MSRLILLGANFSLLDVFYLKCLLCEDMRWHCFSILVIHSRTNSLIFVLSDYKKTICLYKLWAGLVTMHLISVLWFTKKDYFLFIFAYLLFPVAGFILSFFFFLFCYFSYFLLIFFVHYFHFFLSVITLLSFDNTTFPSY